MFKDISKKFIYLTLTLVFALAVATQIKAPESEAMLICVGTWITDEFPDPIFEACVLDRLGLTLGDPICDFGMDTITDLDCSVNIFDGIYAENMNGIEYFTGLLTLDMNGNKISDISGIKNITTLQSVSFANNEITDISSLDDNAGFNPYALDFSNYPLLGDSGMGAYPSPFDDSGLMPFHNGISDISAISGMSNLQALYLAGNSIVDISPVAGLTSLVALWLSNNLIVDSSVNPNSGIESLQNLSNLTSLTLGNLDSYVDYYYTFNEIEDISVINNANMPLLQSLYLAELNITDVSSLADLDALRSLNLSANPIGDFSSIASSNANLVQFCDDLTISLNENDISNTSNYVQFLIDRTSLSVACVSLVTDFSYEDCSNPTGNLDGDGDLAADDSYCIPSTFYIENGAAGGAGCGFDISTPCADFDELSTLGDVIMNPPYEDIEIYIKGSINTTADFVPLFTDGFLCDLSGMTCSSNSISLRSYSYLTGDVMNDWASLKKPVLIMGKNISVEGITIAGLSTMPGVTILGARDSSVKRVGFAFNGFGTIVAGGNGITIENSAFNQNNGSIDVDTIFMGLLSLGVNVPSCGGIGTAGTKDITIVNNSFYNNCDYFSIVANIFDSTILPGDLVMKVADIGIASLEFLPITSVENAIVKQNIVYNDTGSGRGYYYEPSFGSVNGTVIPDFLWDETAVAIGGNNFFSSTVDPYVDSSCVAPSCYADAFYIANPDDYAICDFAPETPSVDLFGATRPDGPLEPGSFESTGGSCGGGSRQSDPCTVQAVNPIDVKSVTSSPNKDGDPEVELSWNEGSVEDINADRKVDILFNYFSQNDSASINTKTEKNYEIDGYGECSRIKSFEDDKQLENVFARYMYEEISNDDSLQGVFNTKLQSLSDREAPAIKDLLNSVGIQTIFADWWPYIALDVLKNTKAGDMFVSSVVGNNILRVDRADNKVIGIIEVFDTGKRFLSPLHLWQKAASTIYRSFKDNFEPAETAMKCIDKQFSAYFSSANTNTVYNPFVAKSYTYFWARSDYEAFNNFLSGVATSKRKQISDAWNKVKKDGRLELILKNIAFDKQLIKLAKYSTDFDALLSAMLSNSHIQDLIELYQEDENFIYFKQLLFGTSFANNIETCIENDFGRSNLINIVKDIRIKMIKGMIESNKNSCDDNVTNIVIDIIEGMQNDSSTKLKIDSLALEFLDDLLQLEQYDKDVSVILGENPNTSFLDYYNSNYESAVDEVIGESSSVNIYRNGSLIDTVDNSIISYTDTDLPTGVRDLSYHLGISTNCGEVEGKSMSIELDPQVEAGTAINTDLDLKITIKEAYNKQFMDKLKGLFEEGLSSESVATTSCEEARNQLEVSPQSANALDYIVSCYGESDGKIERKLIGMSSKLITPLINVISQMSFDSALKNFDNLIKFPVERIKNDLFNEEKLKVEINNLVFDEDNIKEKNSINDLTQGEKDLIKQLYSAYFEGASHAAILSVEKYDKDGVLAATYKVNTDVFGEASVNIGDLLAGDLYTLKVRLMESDNYIKPFVLPKQSQITLNNATYNKSTSKFEADIKLEFDNRFIFGDFDNRDKTPFGNSRDTINLADIMAWGMLGNGLTPYDGFDYDLWLSWQSANLDSISGLDLLDVLTFQENLIKQKQEEFIDEVTLFEFTKKEDIDLPSGGDTSDEEVIDVLDVLCGAPNVSWLNLLKTSCINE